MYYRPEDFTVADRVQEVAKKRGVSGSQIALAWVLNKPYVTAPIIGASRMEHLDQSIAALEIKLSEAENKRLEEPISASHPRAFMNRDALHGTLNLQASRHSWVSVSPPYVVIRPRFVAGVAMLRLVYLLHRVYLFFVRPLTLGVRVMMIRDGQGPACTADVYGGLVHARRRREARRDLRAGSPARSA